MSVIGLFKECWKLNEVMRYIKMPPMVCFLFVSLFVAGIFFSFHFHGTYSYTGVEQRLLIQLDSVIATFKNVKVAPTRVNI